MLQRKVCFLLLLGLASCDDNIGRVFDRNRGGGGNQAPGARILPPPAGALVFSTRPSVVETKPSGSTQTTSPVVVLFSEAMNIDSIADSSTETPSHLYVRIEGTEEPLPGIYDLMMGGRLLVFRPQPAFPPDRTFEVFAGNAVRDIDRATLSRTGVLATFTTDSPLEAGPSVVFDFPDRNAKSQLRESEIFVVLSQVVDRNTIDEDSFFLRESGKTAKIAGAIRFPIQVLGVGDTRIVSFTPSNTLAASTKYDFVYTDDIKAGEISLDVGNQDPPIIFTTQAPVPPDAIEVGNPTTASTAPYG